VFKTNGKEDAASLFDNIIYLSYLEGKVEEVILSFQPIQGKYVKSLPLHRSQKIIKDDKKSLVISLDLIPNFELRQKILMMGETVKVLKPAKLAAEIKRSLANALKQY